jgi:hypothetical protein
MDREQDAAVVHERDGAVVIVAGYSQDQHVTAPARPRSTRSGRDAGGASRRRAPAARKSGQAEIGRKTREGSGERVCDDRVLGISGDLDPPDFLQIQRQKEASCEDGEGGDRRPGE